MKAPYLNGAAVTLDRSGGLLTRVSRGAAGLRPQELLGSL